MHESSSSWVLAVDGGGSKIAIAAMRPVHSPDSSMAKPDSLAAVRTWSFPGTGSAHPGTWSTARDNITQAIGSVIAELQSSASPGVSRIHLALAGAGRVEDQQRVIAHVAEALAETIDCQATSVTCVGDIDPLLDYWADAESPSIAIILGTGSIVASRAADGSMVRAGGWGPNLGDECSGAAIGNSALRDIVRQLDSGAELNDLSPLARRIVELLQSESGNQETITRPWLASAIIQTAADRTQAARLSLLVVEAAFDQSSEEAMRIVSPHLNAICWQVFQVARRVAPIGTPCRLVFGGGLAERSPALRDAILSACQTQGLVIVDPIFANPLLAVLRSALS